MKLKSFLIGILFSVFTVLAFGQTTHTGTLDQSFFGPRDNSTVTWVVADGSFDSADAIYSPPFTLAGGSETFDAQGIIDMGTVATNGTYSTVLLLYATTDAGAVLLADSLGTITGTTPTAISIDLDDFDQFKSYQIKATNGGGDNTFKIDLYRE